MAKVTINESTLTDIGDAIRAKDGTSALIDPIDMGNRVRALPEDTGENGLYKAMIKGNVTEIVDGGLTTIRSYSQYLNTSLVKVSIPNVTNIDSNAFGSCTSLTGIFNAPLASASVLFYRSGCRTIVVKIRRLNQGFNQLGYGSNANVHIWCPEKIIIEGAYVFAAYSSSLRTAQIDDCTGFSLYRSHDSAPNINFYALVLRSKTVTQATASGVINHREDWHIYVPASLVNDYKTATNWTTFAQYFIGIDEDTTCDIGDTFTPMTTATNIDHWDMVDLQSYSVGTVDTLTGAITPTYDGRLLIRGLDVDGNIVHVTYLQIGTGFDEEANLAS